ncbi:putative alpha/beta hydrolase [Diplonema papillatum]|nr:putative alpha/beta hydrolase [Diplonema papillatum]
MLDSFLFPAPEPSYRRSSFSGKLLEHEGVVMLLQYPAKARATFLLFCLHANACDLGQLKSEDQYLADELGCAVLSTEYPGYGIASGTPNMASINNAAWKAFRFAVDRMKVPPRDICIMGRSIGTGVASHLARRAAEQGEVVRGISLISPYTSVLDIVHHHVYFVGNFFWHRWRPKKDLPHVQSPILFIHGCRDLLIKPSHTEKLIAALKHQQPIAGNRLQTFPPSSGPFPHQVYARLSPDADHNNWDYEVDILGPLKIFAAACAPAAACALPFFDPKPFAIRNPSVTTS